MHPNSPSDGFSLLVNFTSCQSSHTMLKAWHFTIPVIAVQAVDAAVAAAVADARVKTKEEVEAASAAKKAAADQQLLRELEDKTEALTNQVNAATEQLRSTETALRCVTNHSINQ